MPREILTVLSRPSREAGSTPADAPAFRFVDPAETVLSALDLGATRGDGIFETISIAGGAAQALEHHLTRFARSAAMLDLPAPDLDAWRDAIRATAEAIEPVPEAFVKAVLTRGIEGSGAPTGWCFGAPSPDFTRERTVGISVVLLDRGVRHDVERTSPWLLAGAKTLSYAVNRAAVREAQRRGADDVVFVSSDGIVLEGPTSTLVYRRGDSLFSPGVGLGILDGTTQTSLFQWAAQQGLTTGFEHTTPDILRAADAAWLVSSMRYAAPIREIDGMPMAVDAAFTAAANEWLLSLRD